MAKENLHQIYARRTGKVSDKWSLYLTEYDRLFAPMADRPVRILEIGVQNGGSLEVWSEYFPKARAIVGCDINPDCARLTFDDSRIGVVVGDANLPEIEAQVLQRSPQFDIIIDDGSHMSSDIVRSFVLYFPRLVSDGLFVAEDLHCSYWGTFEGGLYDPNSSMAFFKRLSDVINHEHWGMAKSRADALRGIFNYYGCELDEQTLAQVHSIEFINSMCVVRKAEGPATLGHRVISGTLELVRPGHLDFNGGAYELDALFDETANVWSNRLAAPSEELAAIGEILGNAVSPSPGVVDEVSHLHQREAALQQREAALQKNLADLEARHRQVIDSRCWRLTAAFRWLGRAIKPRGD